MVVSVSDLEAQQEMLTRITTPGDQSFRTGAESKTGKHCYWKNPNGWVLLLPYNAIELERRIDLGFTPLRREYGEFVVTLNRDWDFNSDPLKPLFLKGGAKELPVDQVLEHQWHLTPPQYGNVIIEFPQLASLDPPVYKCRYCGRTFIEDNHLVKHTSVAHKDQSQNAALGEAFRQVLDRPNADQNELVNAVKSMVEQQNQVMSVLLERLAATEENLVKLRPLVRLRQVQP